MKAEAPMAPEDVMQDDQNGAIIVPTCVCLSLRPHTHPCDTASPSRIMIISNTANRCIVRLSHLRHSARFAFGITARRNNSICYLEGNKLLYPVGLYTAQYNCATKEVCMGG